MTLVTRWYDFRHQHMDPNQIKMRRQENENARMPPCWRRGNPSWQGLRKARPHGLFRSWSVLAGIEQRL